LSGDALEKTPSRGGEEDSFAGKGTSTPSTPIKRITRGGGKKGGEASGGEEGQKKNRPNQPVKTAEGL